MDSKLEYLIGATKYSSAVLFLKISSLNISTDSTTYVNIYDLIFKIKLTLKLRITDL
jgi:hypothetical protein